jgi:hypothetical protein
MATTADEPIARASAPAEVAPLEVAADSVAPSSVAPESGRERMRLADTRPRRTRVAIRHVGVWSVFKFSLLFYACAMLVVWLALLLIFLVLDASGVIATIGDWLGKLSVSTEGTKGYERVNIDGGSIFTWLFVGLAILAFVWAVINTFVAVIYNLISDLIGGIEVTLSERRRG